MTKPRSRAGWLAKAVRLADALVEVLKAVDDLGRCVADPVVVLDVPLPRSRRVGQRGRRHAGENRALRAEVRGDRLTHPVGDVHHRHRVLDADPLNAAGLVILVGARKAREDQRLCAVQDVAAVELGGDMDSEVAVL